MCGSRSSRRAGGALALQQLSLRARLVSPTQQIWETVREMSFCSPRSSGLLPPMPFLGDSPPLPAM